MSDVSTFTTTCVAHQNVTYVDQKSAYNDRITVTLPTYILTLQRLSKVEGIVGGDGVQDVRFKRSLPTSECLQIVQPMTLWVDISAANKLLISLLFLLYPCELRLLFELCGSPSKHNIILWKSSKYATFINSNRLSRRKNKDKMMLFEPSECKSGIWPILLLHQSFFFGGGGVKILSKLTGQVLNH